MVGKLFQMTRPATSKLLVPSVVPVLGADSDQVPANRTCRLRTMLETAKQSSAKYIALTQHGLSAGHDWESAKMAEPIDMPFGRQTLMG